MKFVVSIFCLITFRQTLAENLFEGCKAEYTNGYEYTEFHPINNAPISNPNIIVDLEFYVKASSNAHILLTSRELLGKTSGYEIVIGGGKNSFSQIRLYPKDTKTTQATPNIVSPLEYRRFWIKLTSQGVIMVGNQNSEEPFLFWINNRPFTVKYFAFTTWTHVKGEWFFDCKEKMDPEFIEGEGTMTDLQRLKRNLLMYYNPNNIPEKDGNQNQTIEVNLEVNYFHLDEKHGELTLTGMAFLRWIDWKLVWNSSEYHGIYDIYVTPYQVWTPDVYVLNSLALSKKSLLTLSGGVFATSKGEIAWRVPFHSVTLCILGYKNWPFDTHNCSLVFGFLTEPLNIDIKHMELSKIPQSEWQLQKLEGKDVSISYVTDYGSIIDIRFRRRTVSYEFLLIPSFLGTAVLSLVSFWLHPKSSAKIFLNCGSILILVLILMNIGNHVPSLSTVPKIVLLYSWSLLVMCIPIILFIVLKYIPAYISLSRFMTAVLNSSFIEILFLMPDSAEMKTNYSCLWEQEERSYSSIRLVIFIERFVFLLYFIAILVPFLMFLIINAENN